MMVRNVLAAVPSPDPRNLLLPINGLGACERRQMFQGNRVEIGYGVVELAPISTGQSA
jgi:hypothetical protein